VDQQGISKITEGEFDDAKSINSQNDEGDVL